MFSSSPSKNDNNLNTSSRMVLLLILFVIIHCLATCFSIVLLGDKRLMSGNLYELQSVFALIVNWRFILAMILAVMARVSFMLINSSLLKVPSLANAATTITVFITAISIIFVITANHFFLHETLTLKQGMGGMILITGLLIMISR